MTTVEIQPNEAAIVIRSDGTPELYLPKPDNESADNAHVVATMMIWSAQQRDIRERFEAVLALLE